MDPRQFGQLAAQLLAASNIPGTQIDVALQFRETALALGEGSLTLSPAPVDDATAGAGQAPDGR